MSSILKNPLLKNTVVINKRLQDIAGCVMWLATRKGKGEYEGDCLRLHRDSDDAESDFAYDENGELDTAAISTWLGGSDGYIVDWNDVSGYGNDVSQSVGVDQLLYVENGINGLPTIQFGSGFLESSINSISILNPEEFTMFIVCSPTSVNGIFQTILSSNTASTGFFFNKNNNDRYDFRTGNGVSTDTMQTISAVENTPVILTGKRTDTTSTIYVNDTDSTSRIVDFARNTTQKTIIGANNAEAALFSGYISEIILFNRALSDAERAIVFSDQKQRYNIT